MSAGGEQRLCTARLISIFFAMMGLGMTQDELVDWQDLFCLEPSIRGERTESSARDQTRQMVAVRGYGDSPALSPGGMSADAPLGRDLCPRPSLWSGS